MPVPSSRPARAVAAAFDQPCVALAADRPVGSLLWSNEGRQPLLGLASPAFRGPEVLASVTATLARRVRSLWVHDRWLSLCREDILGECPSR